MPTFIRVEAKDGSAQFDVADTAYDPAMHNKVNASKRWPDLEGLTARPRAPLYRTSKGLVTADGDPAEETQAGPPATPVKGTDQ